MSKMYNNICALHRDHFVYVCICLDIDSLSTEIFVTLLNGFHRQVYSVVLGFQWRDCIWATKKRVHAPPCHAPSPCRPSMPCPIPTTQLEMFAARGIISLVSCLGRYCPGSERIHWSLKLRLLNLHPLRKDKGQ